MSRTAFALLSTENLHHNVRTLRALAPHSKLMVMVKANGYGHGIRSVTKRLETCVDRVGVASIDEALALRKCGITMPILLSEGVFEPSEYLIAATENFSIVIHNHQQLEWFQRAYLPVPIEIWLKIDTGMGRLGFSANEANTVYHAILNHPNCQKPLYVMSHLACAEDNKHPLNTKQISIFKNFIQNTTDPSQTKYSFCNSAAMINFKEIQYHYVRSGLAAYGISPIGQKTAQDFNLKPVMTLHSSLIAISQKQAGDTIGYKALYTCEDNMPIGIIAFGYGDGYPITAQNGTPVLIHGVKCPLVGRVSMDMMAVDLRPLINQAKDTPHLCPKIGDSVILWGDGLPLEEIASHTHNIPYDILTGVQNRVRFLWTPDVINK